MALITAYNRIANLLITVLLCECHSDECHGDSSSARSPFLKAQLFAYLDKAQNAFYAQTPNYIVLGPYSKHFIFFATYECA
jgi:hypothetical protein